MIKIERPIDFLKTSWLCATVEELDAALYKHTRHGLSVSNGIRSWVVSERWFVHYHKGPDGWHVTSARKAHRRTLPFNDVPEYVKWYCVTDDNGKVDYHPGRIDTKMYTGNLRKDQCAVRRINRHGCSNQVTLTIDMARQRADHKAIVLSAIVEGTDWEPACERLAFPFTYSQFEQAINNIESECDYIWSQTHGCEACGTGLGHTGEPKINPDCPICDGEGVLR